MINDEQPPHLHHHHQTLTLSNLTPLAVLGRGAKGVVFLVRHRDSSDNDLLALKVISKSLIQQNQHKNKNHNPYHDTESPNGSEYKRIWFERDVLGKLNHPLLPKLKGVLESNELFGYAMDYCPGRDLNSLRRSQSEKMFSDEIIRFYAAELVLILEYLHKMGIVHRDLKPENVMIQENGHLMLIDFDLSTKILFKSLDSSSLTDSASESVSSSSTKSSPSRRRRSVLYKWCNSGISPEERNSIEPEIKVTEPGCESNRSDSSSSSVVVKSNSFVGTEEYVAPEIIKGEGHDLAVDWWSLGVVLHEMLYGATPFRGANKKETFYRILSKEVELVGEMTALRDLIKKLLEKDGEKRIGVEEIKAHEFFRGVEWENVMEISRPPWIPPQMEEELKVSEGKGIDVEVFVNSVFSGEKAGKDEAREAGSDLNQPSQANDFLVF